MITIILTIKYPELGAPALLHMQEVENMEQAIALWKELYTTHSKDYDNGIPTRLNLKMIDGHNQIILNSDQNITPFPTSTESIQKLIMTNMLRNATENQPYQYQTPQKQI